jgi:hypothetical protein
MLKIRARFEAACPRHRLYNPEKHGEGGIKGGCECCGELLKAEIAKQDFLATLAALEERLRALGARVTYGVPAKVLPKAAKAGR